MALLGLNLIFLRILDLIKMIMMTIRNLNKQIIIRTFQIISMRIMDLIIKIKINSNKERNIHRSQINLNRIQLMKIPENTKTNKEIYGIRNKIIKKPLNFIQRRL